MTDDLEAMRFNTAISRLMEFTNFFTGAGGPAEVGDGDVHPAAGADGPAPGRGALADSWATTKTLAYEPWPAYDPALLKDDEIEVPVQVNGKLRATVVVPADADGAAIEAAARADERIAAMLEGKTIRKVVVVPGKLVNFVVG